MIRDLTNNKFGDFHFGKYLLFCVSLIGLSGSIQAQVTGSPQVYSSTGGTGNVNSNFVVDFTVGESVVTTIDPQNGSNILTQGFQQPRTDSIIVPGGTDSVIGIYTGFTPNGDDHNETWIINGIDTIPENFVAIYNRWGQLIWQHQHYNNSTIVWAGQNMSGGDVNSGTYYYTIELKGRKNFKGWVELTR